jgi:hypothetical protein
LENTGYWGDDHIPKSVTVLASIGDFQEIMISKPYQKLKLWRLHATHANLCAQIDPATA